MEKKNVFISYKSEEWKEAELIKSALEDKGISCWIAPRDIPGGSNYAREIDRAIDNCSVLVLVLSSIAQKSKWIPKELDCAINSNKIILPFQLEECPLEGGFRLYLTNIQMYQAYRDKSGELNRLVGDIAEITNVKATKDTKPSYPQKIDVPMGNTSKQPPEKKSPEQVGQELLEEMEKDIKFSSGVKSNKVDTAIVNISKQPSEKKSPEWVERELFEEMENDMHPDSDEKSKDTQASMQKKPESNNTNQARMQKMNRRKEKQDKKKSYAARIVLAIIAFMIFAFVYRQGMIKNAIFEFLVFISPYGRGAAMGYRFGYPLAICSVCTGIAYLFIQLFALLLSDIMSLRKRLLIPIISGFAIWYAAFGVCHWIVKIPVFYEVLAAIAAVVATLLISLIAAIIAICFVDTK